MKKILLLAVLIMACSTAYAKSEAVGQDAAPVVIYGSSDGGTTLVPLKVDADGVVYTSGGSGGTASFPSVAAGSLIYAPTTGTVFVTTSPTLNITGGNIGIGTTAPTVKLDVVGNGNFSGTVQAGTGTFSTINSSTGSVNFTTPIYSATTATLSISGNAATATALAANPSACSAGQYVSDIAANGTLTCGVPTGSGSGTILSGTEGQFAFYSTTGTVIMGAPTITYTDGVTTIDSPLVVTGALTISGSGTTYFNEFTAGTATINGLFYLNNNASAAVLSTDASGKIYTSTESDPIFIASDAYVIDTTSFDTWNGAGVEADPVFLASVAADIDATSIDTWNAVSGGGTGAIVFNFSGGGSTLTTSGQTFIPVYIPFDATITGWQLDGGVAAGTATISISKGDAYSGSTDIDGSMSPSLVGSLENSSADAAGWTTALSNGDKIWATLNSGISTVQFLNLSIETRKQ